MPSDLEYWNRIFEKLRREGEGTASGAAAWLDAYLPLFAQNRVQRVLEVGCGSGQETEVLVQAGFHVTATDFSTSALTLVRDKLPEVDLLLHDTRDPFPFGNESYDVIVASLSLHYFDEATTATVVQELQRLLRHKGLLLYRVNSTSDANFTYGQGDLLEPNFFLQQGVRRRYFTLDTCRQTFRGWEEIYLEEKKVHTYGKVKALCEGLVRKV